MHWHESGARLVPCHKRSCRCALCTNPGKPGTAFFEIPTGQLLCRTCKAKAQQRQAEVQESAHRSVPVVVASTPRGAATWLEPIKLASVPTRVADAIERLGSLSVDQREQRHDALVMRLRCLAVGDHPDLSEAEQSALIHYARFSTHMEGRALANERST